MGTKMKGQLDIMMDNATVILKSNTHMKKKLEGKTFTDMLRILSETMAAYATLVALSNLKKNNPISYYNMNHNSQEIVIP